MPELNEVVREIVKEVMDEYLQQDSIEIGTPGRGGVLKLYFNAANEEQAKEKIKKAADLLKFARGQLTEG